MIAITIACLTSTNVAMAEEGEIVVQLTMFVVIGMIRTEEEEATMAGFLVAEEVVVQGVAVVVLAVTVIDHSSRSNSNRIEETI
jgi:hypothetical protein